MGNVHDRISKFLPKDRSIKSIKSKIRYSNYSFYEDKLLEFCIWVNNFEKYDEIKKVLSKLPISFFCNKSEIFLTYISKNKEFDEDKAILEINAIIEAIIHYNVIVYNNQLFTTFNQLTFKEYQEEDLDYLFGLYNYYLTQEDKPIINKAIYDFYLTVDKLPQSEFLIDVYKKLAMDFESDIRKNFIRLSKKRLECSKQLGASELRIVNRNNYTKILRHLKNENM